MFDGRLPTARNAVTQHHGVLTVAVASLETVGGLNGFGISGDHSGLV
jgi:hypothetical protein